MDDKNLLPTIAAMKALKHVVDDAVIFRVIINLIFVVFDVSFSVLKTKFQTGRFFTLIKIITTTSWMLIERSSSVYIAVKLDTWSKTEAQPVFEIT
jgi:hypothetical protein